METYHIIYYIHGNDILYNNYALPILYITVLLGIRAFCDNQTDNYTNHSRNVTYFYRQNK